MKRKTSNVRVIKETCIAGLTIDHVIKVPSGNHKGRRAKKVNPSNEAVKKNNDRIAVRNLTRLINANFGIGSSLFTLTYRVIPEMKELKKNIEAFIKKVRRRLPKLKYIFVCGLHGRPHFHILMNTENITLVKALWNHGDIVSVKPLDSSGNYKKLAEYLIGNTKDSFREKTSPFKQRYSCSRNLVRPTIYREIVDISNLYEEPVPIKGYYIDKDSIRRYEHPVTGIEHLEYMEVALNKPRKRWGRGEIVKPEKPVKEMYYEQLNLLIADSLDVTEVEYDYN